MLPGLAACVPEPPPAVSTSQFNSNMTSSEYWVNCANEGNTCSFPGMEGIVTVRYGNPGNYLFAFLEGIDSVSCTSTVFNGTPSGGTNTCSFINKDLLSIEPNSDATHWVTCASENQPCNNVGAGLPDGLVWLRFGNDDQWLYTVAETGETPTCSVGAFGGYNPPSPSKICQYGGLVFPAAPQTTIPKQCATEHNECDIPQTMTMVSRYGINQPGHNYWFNRIEIGGDFSCDNTEFDGDPRPGANKICSFTPLAIPNATSEGLWKRIASCTNCDHEVTYSQGTATTDEYSTAKEWGTSVSASITSSFKVFGKGVEVGATASADFRKSAAFVTALSQEFTSSTTTSCVSDDAGVPRQLYQFGTATMNSCLGDGTCAGKTMTNDFMCILNPYAGYSGPKCLPGYCNPDDPLCDTCAYPE